MTAPLHSASAFKDRLEQLRAKIERDMRAFAPSRSHSISESLRKLVK